MRTIDEVRGRCRIDEITGCWLWAGAKQDNCARIYAPDWTAAGGAMRVQPARRAVWHLTNPGKALPNGWRVYGTCLQALCVSPRHAQAGTARDQGRSSADLGRFKDKPQRILANRKTALKLSTLTPELVAEILASDESHADFERRTGIGRSIVGKIRSGKPHAHRPLGGLFTGLVS